MLKGKKILVGITGSIAAYKSAQIIRLLVKKGALVKVVMTPLAKEFISPLTVATLSKNSVMVDFFDPTNGAWNSHVSLGMWADAFLIAPATANTIGKMANGVADNLLLTSYLSAKCPVFVAPAMDLDMYAHPTTVLNLRKIKSFGVNIIEPESGELASGLEGKGRMEEPETIVQYLREYFTPKQLLGKKVLITAGPTYEKIDPVRFIGNYSSGKMGFALAESCAAHGAEVLLITGPTELKIKSKKIQRINVQSAAEMYDTVIENFPEMDGAILCAAVADYTPVKVADEKLKRTEKNMTLTLEPTRDIASEVGKMKRANQFTIGFALETSNEVENAHKKLDSKNFDFIILNSLNDENAGFGYDTNKITIIHKTGREQKFDNKSKKAAAEDIVNELITG